jgi:hypothetical protein
MSFGLKIENGKAGLPAARKKTSTEQTQKNVSKLLRDAGIPINNDDIADATQLALGSLGISATDQGKEFSLLDEQTNGDKIANPNVQSNKLKKRNSLASNSFPNKEDPFFEAGPAKPIDEATSKVNEQRKTTYTKSIPVANYLATINSVK